MSTIDYLLRYIGEDTLNGINKYLDDVLDGEFKVFESEEDISKNLDGYLEDFLGKLNYDEASKIKNYTGLSFRRINSILRNSWDYEVNGRLTPEIKEESRRDADEIRKILLKSEELPMAVKTYRGVNLSTFYQYGVTRMEDLSSLEGKFLYEDGFTSTSLLRGSSFFYKPTDWGEKATIEIEYLIPKNCDDGALINCSDLSFSPGQNEFLINSGSLFKVMNVEVSQDKKTAKMKIAFIPQKIWCLRDYEMERKECDGSITFKK